MSRPRTRWIVFASLLLVAVLATSLYWLSRPGRVPTLLLDQIGASLGLEISASGATEYHLRGTPKLLLNDVVARQPGSATPLLRAGRVYLSLPWSTIRARGADLTVKRIELDDAQLDLPALQRWLATRPPSEETRVPTLTDGLRIRGGSIVNRDARGLGWRIVGISADVASLHPDRLLQTRLRGRYLDPPLAVPFDLAIALHTPAALANGDVTGVGGNGRLQIDHGDWRLPAHVVLSGPLQWGRQGLRISPMRMGLSARYESSDTQLPFALGLHGPLAFDRSTWTLAPVGVALRGRGAIPVLDARGALALGRRLALQLDGTIAQWPDAWPTLPPPIGQSRSPLPFELHYVGAAELSDVASLRLQRDATTFDARFRLPVVLQWLDNPAASPLPPLDGRLQTPRLEISGALLEGVEVQFADDSETAP